MDRHDANTGFAKRTYISMDDAEIFRTVEEMMCEEKVFLDPNLTMDALADKMGVHRNSLSRSINRYTHKNFASYLARYRVQEAERLVTSSAGSKIKLSELALKAGFSSHTPFYRAVRAIRGTTPSAAFKVLGERDNKLSNKPNKNKNHDL